MEIKMREYLESIMTKIELPAEATASLLAEWDKMEKDGTAEIVYRYLDLYTRKEKLDYDKALKELNKAKKALGESYYPAHTLLFLCLSKPMHDRYKEQGICDQIYYDSVKDLKWKLQECYEMYGIWGSFVAWWEPGFFEIDRFAIGRLQYEYCKFGHRYTGRGFTVNPDDMVLGMHIPSSGPLLIEDCMESLKMAHEFYRDKFPSGITIFTVDTCLLYLGHREFLPETSRIIQFMDMFDIFKNNEAKDRGGDMWRIFGKYEDEPVEKLPRDTGLRRAYAERLEKGGKVGGGCGIIFFDGEKIIR